MRAWVALCAYFDKVIEDYVLPLYVQDLEDANLQVDEVLAAMAELRRQEGRKFAPRPNDVIAILRQQLSPRDEAVDVVGVIWNCISFYGHPNPAGARKAIGERGWTALMRFTNWNALCAGTLIEDGNAFRAQLRDFLAAQFSSLALSDTRRRLAAHTVREHNLLQTGQNDDQ